MCVNVLQAVPCDRFQKLSNGEDGARVEPTAHVVAADVIEERLGGYGKQDMLQLLEVLHGGNLLVCSGVAEYEIAEAYLFSQYLPQVKVHVLGVLVDEGCPEFFGIQCIFSLGRLDDKRHERVVLAHMMTELDASQRVFLLSLYLWEAHVSDNT